MAGANGYDYIFKMINKLFVTLLAVFLFCSKTTAQNGLLWEIKSPEGATSYLFGTNHVIQSGYIKAHPKVEKAFTNADQIVVETIFDPNSAGTEILAAGLMEKSLNNLLDSADYWLVKQELEVKLGMPMAQLNNFKPMVAMSLITLQMYAELLPEEMKYDGETMDLYLASAGQKMGKKVVGMEEIGEQANLLYNYAPVEEQALDLVNMIKDKERASEMSLKLLLFYKREQLDSLFVLSEDYGDDFGDMTSLLDDRNINWIPKLQPLLESGNIFIGVGALHLPGKNGLINLLQNKGFTVTPVK